MRSVVHQVGALNLLTTATFFPEMYLPQNDWNRGTYRELKAILNELPERYLDQTATILLEDSDEYVAMGSIGWTGPASTLDSDHMFFTVDA